jgi:hypothetical protein
VSLIVELTVTTVHRPSTLIRCGFLSKLGMIRHLKDGLAWALMKGVASCDKLRVGARGLRSGDALMGLPVAGYTATPLIGVGTPRTETSQ